MYPDFRYLIHALFGVNAPEWLGLFKTFGFMVAMGFVAATWVMVSELKRKEKQGILQPGYEEVKVGSPLTAVDLLWAAVIGFILGFKLGGFVTLHLADISQNPMGYFMSMQGNAWAGVIGAALLALLKYREKKKQTLPQVEIRKVLVYPHQRIGEILIIAALGGLAGAKIFNALETWDQFIADPIGNLTSSSGLTFYGGLIVATAVFYYFSKKHKIGFAHLCDAAAPAIMIAYGIGRLGCQFAGDGDWGIYNSAYVTNVSTGKLEPATSAQFNEAVEKYKGYLTEGKEFQNGHLPSQRVMAPAWLPQSLFAQCYPSNINNVGIRLPNCTGDHCNVLPIGVFPTPLYEFVICTLLFFLLWSIRKRIKVPFHFFGIYLILNGLERFFVEHIRVNYQYNWGFIHPTQAEIIAVGLMLAGVAILVFYKGKPTPNNPPAPTPVL